MTLERGQHQLPATPGVGEAVQAHDPAAVVWGERRVQAPDAIVGTPVRALQDIRYDIANRVETYATTNLPGLWKLVQRVPAVHRRVNGMLIDRPS